jgi:hypothetical protein
MARLPSDPRARPAKVGRAGVCHATLGVVAKSG